MFSMAEKRKISEEVEKLLLSFEHPEMPKEKVKFMLHVQGRANLSWANIEPNWVFDDGIKVKGINTWNEISRDVLKKEC